MSVGLLALLIILSFPKIQNQTNKDPFTLSILSQVDEIEKKLPPSLQSNVPQP